MSKSELDQVRLLFCEAVAAFDSATNVLKGRSVRITGNYNGQPYGSSKPNLKGQIKTIERLHFDMQWGISLKLGGCRLFIKLDEVELI